MLGQLLEHVVEVGEDEPVSIRAPPVRDHAVWQNDDVPGLLFAVHDELAEGYSSILGIDHLPYLHAGAVYAALRRRDRDLEDARHFLVGKADEVPQYERSSVFERQLPDPAGEECVQLPGLRRPLRFVDPSAPHERAVVVRRVRHRPMLRPRISADYDESAWTMGASKERWSS